MMPAKSCILGCGHDVVDIERFESWHNYSLATLQRIFSPEEIDYCLKIPFKQSERFAVRFATREAFFKALGQFCTQLPPFLTVCSALTIKLSKTGPQIIVDVKKLAPWYQLAGASFFCSLTHSRTIASAFVIITQATCAETSTKSLTKSPKGLFLKSNIRETGIKN